MVSTDRNCVESTPQRNPHINNYCGDDLYYSYKVDDCEYNRYHMGCTGEGICGTEKQYVSTTIDTLNVSVGKITTDETDWINISPEKEVIQRPSLEHNLDINYISDDGQCEYEQWFLGCPGYEANLDNQSDYCTLTYSVNESKNVGYMNISIEQQCSNNTPEVEMHCDVEASDVSTSYCRNFTLSTNRFACDGWGSTSPEFIICPEEYCNIGICNAPFNPGPLYYTDGIRNYTFNLRFDETNDNNVTCMDFENHFGNYLEQNDTYWGGLSGNPYTCEIVIENCVEDLCYDENGADNPLKCSQKFDEVDVSDFVNEEGCIINISDSHFVCCTSEACGNQKNKYVPLRILFDGHESKNVTEKYIGFDWGDCDICDKDINDDFEDFIADPNCYNASLGMVCCNHKLCGVNINTFVPLASDFVWSIGIELPDGLERYEGDGTPWNLPTPYYYLNTTIPDQGPGSEIYEILPKHKVAEEDDIIEFIVYGGSNNQWNVTSGDCEIINTTDNTFLSWVTMGTDDCEIKVSSGVKEAYAYLLKDEPTSFNIEPSSAELGLYGTQQFNTTPEYDNLIWRIKGPASCTVNNQGLVNLTSPDDCVVQVENKYGQIAEADVIYSPPRDTEIDCDEIFDECGCKEQNGLYDCSDVECEIHKDCEQYLTNDNN